MPSASRQGGPGGLLGAPGGPREAQGSPGGFRGPEGPQGGGAGRDTRYAGRWSERIGRVETVGWWRLIYLLF